MKLGFLIDHRKCIGCHACSVACKEEHQVPLGVYRTWVKYVEKGAFPNTRRHFTVLRCNHCEDAPCVTICPVTALYKRSDGIVDFDSNTCIGCKACMQACPYDALYIDPNSHTAAKCNFCAHRVEVGLRLLRLAFGLQIAKKRGGKAQVKSAGQRQDVLVDQCFEDERAAKGARRAVLPEVLDAGEDLRLPRIEAQLAQDLWSNLRAGETI